MLFKKRNAPELTEELFQNPTSEYRGAPFWAWNSELDEKELLFQIEAFKKMGFGGFNMHARKGLATEYLSDTFMNRVKACVKKAKKEDMYAWLYDEDRWPSGFAGGFVTRDEKYRCKRFILSPECPTEDIVYKDYGLFDIVRDETGSLAEYRRIANKEDAVGEVWYAYVQLDPQSPWFNNQTYVDTLNPEAIRKFIEITHEAYKKAVGKEFDKTVPTIFTDEPQIAGMVRLNYPTSKYPLSMTWTDDFEETYFAAYGESIVEKIPELFWNLPDFKVSSTRHHYHEHVSNRFVDAYMKQCGEWCAKNNIALAGHMMDEPTLGSQTGSGQAMAAYGSFQIPGVDNLAIMHEFNTLKQCQSAVRQYGKEGMLSELYGITSWDFDFRDYKMNGDWQAAMGVTIRVPHLSFLSMEGESKRDYPASIGYQSPWFEKFSLIEDHYARLSTALTRGKSVVHIGVIHPIESYWLYYGPRDQNAAVCDELEENFENINKWLTFGGLDFDYICEATLPELCKKGGAPLKVGEMAYDVVIVPACHTIKKSTLKRLDAFAKAGGKLIFMGEAPAYMDAVPSELPLKLYKKSTAIPFSHTALLRETEGFREVEIRRERGGHTNNVLYQMRQDGEDRWLFICRAEDSYNKNISYSAKLNIKIKGKWNIRLYDTLTGEIRPMEAKIGTDATYIAVKQYEQDSYLLRLSPAAEEKELPDVPHKETIRTYLETKPLVPYSLGAPNAFLLDMAEYVLDDEMFNPREEIIRIDTACRKKLGWDESTADTAQPWCIPEEPAEHCVKLRFRIHSAIRVFGVMLALERPEVTKIVWNGTELPCKSKGYFVDHSIKTIRIPVVNKGENILEATVPFDKKNTLEWMYLIGNFGVNMTGSETKIIPLAENLAYGNIVPQTLPFYSGTVDYHMDITVPDTCDGDTLSLIAPQYKGTLIEVLLDGKESGHIIYPPYQISLGKITAGAHRITLRLYVPRINAFGPVHFTDEKCCLYGPDVWRSEGCWFSYEYRLREEGILTKPEVWCEK